MEAKGLRLGIAMIAFMTSAMILQFWTQVVFGGLIYWLPTIVAFARGSDADSGFWQSTFCLDGQ